MIDFAKKKVKFLKLLLDTFAYFKIFFLLCLLWFVFSGSNKTFMIMCGVLSIVMTFFVCVFFKIISPKTYVVRLGFFKYVFILLRDVVISSIDMVKTIFSDKVNINPGTISVNTGKLNEQEKVMFSNLITMTPGTFVIAVNGDDNFLIHALNRDDFENGDNKELVNLFKKMRR